jgi:hypothetical protein
VAAAAAAARARITRLPAGIRSAASPSARLACSGRTTPKTRPVDAMTRK